MIDNDENEVLCVSQRGRVHAQGRQLEKLSTQFSACELSKVTTGHNPKSNGQQNKFGADRGVGGLGWEGQLKSDALFVIPRDCHSTNCQTKPNPLMSSISSLQRYAVSRSLIASLMFSDL